MTLSELGAEHGIHPTVIGRWKQQATEGLAGVFDAGEPATKTISEAEVEKRHAKIDQLLVERDFWRRHLVNERGAEEGPGRTISLQAVDRDAMPAFVDQPV